MEAKLEQQLCVLGSNEGVFAWHAQLPKLPSPVVNSAPQPRVMIYSHNRLAVIHHHQFISTPSLQHKGPPQCRQTKPRRSQGLT